MLKIIVDEDGRITEITLTQAQHDILKDRVPNFTDFMFPYVLNDKDPPELVLQDGPVFGMLNSCKELLLKRWQPTLHADPSITTLPASSNELAAFIIARPEYKNKKQLDDEAAALRKAEEDALAAKKAEQAAAAAEIAAAGNTDATITGGGNNDDVTVVV